jgi:hypothetical protein
MRTSIFALAPLALLAVACSASVEADPTGATSEAIIPIGPILLPDCETEALSTTSVGKAIDEQPGNCAWSNEASSPSASYGGEWCSDTYVVEVDKLIANEAFNAFGGPFETPGSSTSCSEMHSSVTVWAHSASGWKTLGTNTSQGKWETGSLFSLCMFVTDSQTGTLTVKGTEGFDEIRIGVSAWEAETVNGTAEKIYVPVTAGISGGAAC